jgi:hypothetical protein
LAPVAAGVSFFGCVIEYPEEIFVIESDLTPHRIPGSATRWRVFPRAHWYPNHLHVVLDDHLEIIALNGDLFSEQREKLSGIEFQGRTLRES